MTQADEHFINTCKEILEHGYSSEGTGVRTRDLVSIIFLL